MPPAKALAALGIHDGGLPPAPPAAAPALQGDRVGKEAEEPAAPGVAADAGTEGQAEEAHEEEGGERAEGDGLEAGDFPPPAELIATASDPGPSGPQRLVRACLCGVYDWY